jgi:hypothetical protein
MDLSILCWFFFESSELIFDRPKTSLDGNFFHTFLYFHFCDPKLKVGTFVVIPACRAKCTLQNILLEFFLSFDQASEFSFFLDRDF